MSHSLTASKSKEKMQVSQNEECECSHSGVLTFLLGYDATRTVDG